MTRIVALRERPVAISRYDDPAIPSGDLTTSIVAVVTDAVRNGRRVVGYGFSSIGRFAQTGLIRERFAPRLLAAAPAALALDDGSNLDPMRAWNVMMSGEKPGGHGERCVAAGTLDMALWDAAAKIAGVPLYAHIRATLGRPALARARYGPRRNSRRAICGGSKISPTRSISPPGRRLPKYIRARSPRAKRSSPPPKPSCSRGTAGYAWIAISCCSIRRTRTDCPSLSAGDAIR